MTIPDGSIGYNDQYSTIPYMTDPSRYEYTVCNSELQKLLQYLKVKEITTVYCTVYSVRKEMKCSGDSDIIYEIVRDTTRKSEKHEL